MTTAPNEPTHIGDTQVRLLVPSRRQDGGLLNRELRSHWRAKAGDKMDKLFRGHTPSEVHGAFQHEDGRCTREEITVLTSACFRSALADEAKRKELSVFAAEMCGALGQESVFIGWGDDSYVVSQEFEFDAVPVIRFTDLSADAQLTHLTMGWAGIDHPAKILQVLSLDGWTLPKDVVDASADVGVWKLCGVLHEPSGTRRAWAWAGRREDLKPAWSPHGAAGATNGDLVFASGDPGYLDVYVISGKRLLGPRDLRLSHGQLNPVTSQLLRRILHRQWAALDEELRRKPLDQTFFPKLQKVRAAIENELLSQDISALGLASGSSHSGTPHTAAPIKKKKKTLAATGLEATAFRESVLIVGRMMFLRFLIQKGCIPGGLEGMKQQANKLGNDFFSRWVVPLWFDMLNEPVHKRDPQLVRLFGEAVPYLNGGLFVPRRGERTVRLSGGLFDETREVSFFKLFADFEFSLNEHDGSENSLKIDPSFFGKALESFNPDLEKKKHGVHYTPKPIARALAAEAIIARTAALADVSPSVLQGLLAGREAIPARKAREVRRVLEELKIIDPAVGSGVLLWAALRVLMDLDSACDGVIRGSDGYQPGSDEWGVRSRHFVCNCLYGVDISDEAIELSRLRLWLAVALSEDEPAALPDLELNICRGDSLLPDALLPSGGMPSRGGQIQTKLPYDEVGRLEQDLRDKTAAYIGAGAASPDEQRRLLDEVHAIRRKLALRDQDAGQDPTLNWNLFFPHVFSDPHKRGFDVVIANPPYVRVQQVNEKLRELYRSQWKTLTRGSADLSFAFIELAMQKLAAINGGQIAFIQPNFRHHDAADALRQLLTGHDPNTPARLRLWVDFDDAQVFPTASNYVALLFAERPPERVPQADFAYTTPVDGAWKDPERGDDIGWLRPQGRTDTNSTTGDWLTVPAALRARVMQCQAKAKHRLADIATVDVGVQTSKDDVFLFKSFSSRENGEWLAISEALGAEVEFEEPMLRRCLKGAARTDYVLLFPYDQDGNLLSAEHLARRFPKTWKYLQQVKGILEKRESGRFKGSDWYRFGRSQGTVACNVPKLLVPATLNKPTVVPDPAGAIAFTASGKGGGGAWAIYSKDASAETLRYLERLLLSDSTWDHYLAYGSPQKGGWRGVDQGVLRSIPALEFAIQRD